MVKLILPIELTAEIEPHLPSDTKFVRVDSDGNFDGDPSDAEVDTVGEFPKQLN